MPFRLLDDGAYRGVQKEVPAWLLERGYLADASNLIFDKPGVARQRHGTTALSALGAQTAYGTSLGFAHSADSTTIEELYAAGGKSGRLYVVNKTTGASTDLGLSNQGSVAADTIYGRPAKHFGFIAFPGRGTPGAAANNQRGRVAAGSTSTTVFGNTANATIATGDNVVTLTGADATTNVRVGATVLMVGGGSAYFGRVVAILTGTTFSVYPNSPYTVTAAGGSLTTSPWEIATNAACAASFQNRLLYGNVLQTSTEETYQDRRIIYSVLPTETIEDQYGGATWLNIGTSAFPELNFIEAPAAGPIVSMEPVDDNELLILHSQGVSVFRGDLATQTTTFAPGVTFDIFPLNTIAGCLNDLSVVRTPHGILWASTEGVMAYRGGGRIDDLTENTYHTEWMRLVNGSSFAIHGAAYVGNHYIVTGISGGTTFALAYNLDNGAWAPLSAIDWFMGASQPTNPQRVFALRWWDQAGAAPSHTNGQTIRADSIFNPDTAAQTKTDADGAVVAFSGTSRTLTDDQHVERLVRQVAVRFQAQMAAASVTVNVGARLDSTDTVGTETVLVGSLSNTSVLTVTNATNASPIVITTAAHGLQSEDEVDIHSVAGNTAANGHWRITVISSTTFSLNQSSGNGAYTSGGDVKRQTEQAFPGQTIDIGQGTYVVLASSGTVNRFEWHGLRVSAMEFSRALGRA